MSSNDGSGQHRSRPKGLLKEKLELEKVKTRDGKTRWTVKPIEDELTFDKGFYVFIRALQLLRSHNEGVVLVGLGGASGSGKTAFSARVEGFMPGITVISMDNYNDASKLVDGNFDDPRLTDYDLLLQNLADLKQGKPAQVPIYDFKQSRRVGFNSVAVPESRVVIIEGIYALSDRLRPLLDLRVSIAGGVHFDLVKRVLRDISRSGQGPEEIIQQITDTVFPMYKAFIEPDLQAAQLKIHNSFNPFTGFMNATYILKAPRQQDLTKQQVVSLLGEGCVVKTDAEVHDIHLLPPNEDPETCASWLRMRNRDGRYTLLFEEAVAEGNFIISPRIQFEVSVRVLGGLMSLGYEIGTIMRRTSTLMTTAGGDLTVKFDDVEHLGKFVQVQGKDRDRVAALAESLGLAEFVPRSYIEQVQLSKLTRDFQIFTDDVRRRFSMSSNNQGGDGDPYGSSPPLFGSSFGGSIRSLGRGGQGRTGGSRFGGGGGRSSGLGGSSATRAGYNNEEGDGFGDDLLGDEGLLSTSAPVRGSAPIAIGRAKASGGSGSAAAGAAAGAGGGSGSSLGAMLAAGGTGAMSPTSSAAAAAGSTVACSSVPSISSEDGNGSLAGSLDVGDVGGSATAAPAAVRHGSSVAASSGGGSQHRRSSSLLGQQLRRSANGSSGSLAALDPAAAASQAAAAGINGSDAGFGTTAALQQQQQAAHARMMSGGTPDFSGSSMGNLGKGPDSTAALRRLQDQMDVVSEGFRRHSGMQLHLDALTVQYKHINESMAALTAATQALQACVQVMQQQQQQQGSPQVGGVLGGGSSSSMVLLAAGAAAGLLAGACGLLVGRRVR